MIDDDLKPCPFCGSRGATLFGATRKGTETFEIRCTNLQCHVITKRYSTRAEAKDSWNKRVEGVNEGDGMKEIHNAQIVRAELSGWDGGYTMLTYCLTLEMDNGFSLGYGMYNLGGNGQQTHATEDILKLLEVAGAKDWCDLKGKYVRIEFESEGMGTAVKNKRLGHITKDIWHDIDKIYADTRGVNE